MGRKGWWRQIQSGDYPETQTNYGQDLEALHGFRGDRPIADQNKKTKKLQKKCAQCGKLYWADKNTCNNCGHTNKKSKPSKYSKPKRSASFSVRHPPAERKPKQRPDLPEGDVIICNNCNHKKLISKYYLERLKKYYSIENSIVEVLHRFKCSRCGEKDILLKKVKG